VTPSLHFCARPMRNGAGPTTCGSADTAGRRASLRSSQKDFPRAPPPFYRRELAFQRICLPREG
jgi:hypothetical protein